MRFCAPHHAHALILASAAFALPLSAPIASAQNQTPNAQVQSGVDAWKAGDFDAAVRYWMPAANNGNADAQFNMGQAFKLGRGVVTSLADAEIWYRRAAEQGHLQSEDNLGLTLFTMGKREEAMPFIRRSAARGEARTQFLLGTAHYNGDLAEKDWPRAYALIHRASETGLSLAKSRIIELDRLIPEDQRKLGLALLPEMRRAEDAARLSALPNAEGNAAVPAAPTAMARSSVAPPQPLQVIALPASQVSASLDAATQPDAPDEAPAPPRPAAGVTFAAPPAKANAAPIAAPAQQPAIRQPAPVPAPAKAPAPKPIPTAKPKATPLAPIPATGRWRAQLGSFSIPENARNMWKQAASQYGELRGKKPIYAASGRYTRLLAEGFTSQAQAAAFCAKVRANGGSCLVSSQ